MHLRERTPCHPVSVEDDACGSGYEDALMGIMRPDLSFNLNVV